MTTLIVDRLPHPVIQAPMAGGPSTSRLAAAVSNAGGLGFVAGGYRSAAELTADIRSVRAATAAPFGVNLFVPGRASDAADVAAYLDSLGTEASRYGVALGDPRFHDDDWDDKLGLLTADAAPVVSFTFGCPSPSVIDRLRRSGSEVWVTVCTVGDALVATEAGADALVVQGWEAGGHQSTFADTDVTEGLSLVPLLRLVSAATSLPLVAAGGIADGASLAAALAAGAVAGQLGTAFLDCPEAATNEAHRRALAEETPTRMTRAFTGRLARGLVNRFLLEHSASAPAAYPEIHFATAPLRAAARRAGDGGGFNMWAGQAHQLSTAQPAADVVRTISDGARLALRDAAQRFDAPAAAAP